MPPKQSKEEREKALEEFRHEQTVRRWRSGNAKKPSKVVYVSDFMHGGTGAANRGKPCERTRGAGVLVSGTLLLGGHGGSGPTGGTARITGEAARRKGTKQRNPNSSVPFNHRKQFTALKRRIHAQRERAMHDAQVPDAGHDSGDSERTANSIARAQQLVHEMDLLHGAMDAAMRARQFSLAGRLRRQIRHRRYQVRRCLLTRQREAAGDAADDERKPTLASEPTPTVPSYVNHYPPTVLLGVGLHPRHDAVDRRTGRYPRAVAIPTAQRFAREAADFSLHDQASELADLCLATTNGDALGESSEHKDKKGRGGQSRATSCAASSPPQLFVGHYCRNVLTDFLDDLTFTTLQGLYKEQGELKQKQPMQFKARQRYVVGFKETMKHLRAGRVKLVILAADVEVGAVDEASPQQEEESPTSTPAPVKTPGKGRRAFQTLDEAVSTVVSLCEGGEERSSRHQQPLLVTCMSRQRLSYALYAKGSTVACVGILQAEKHLDLVKALRLLAMGLHTAYERV